MDDFGDGKGSLLGLLDLKLSMSVVKVDSFLFSFRLFLPLESPILEKKVLSVGYISKCNGVRQELNSHNSSDSSVFSVTFIYRKMCIFFILSHFFYQ